MSVPIRTTAAIERPADVHPEITNFRHEHLSTDVPLRHRLLLALVAVVVLLGFLGLGALVATPLFGLTCGLLTFGLVGLGWVMV